jgi:hypothetical protein
VRLSRAASQRPRVSSTPPANSAALWAIESSFGWQPNQTHVSLGSEENTHSAAVMYEFAEAKRKIAALHELNEIETFC